MKILITGAHGFVGTRLMKELEGAIAAPSIQGMNQEQIKRIVEESEADVIIHTAAISDVGTCEKTPEASYHANVLLPVYLANSSDGRKLICFSSDQVYRGCESDGPYREDEAKPANIYGAHKLEMEQRVLDRQPDSVMLRAEWMYDYISPRGNYLLNVLNAEETLTFGKQYRGITYLREVCENMERVIKLPGGVYNFGSETTQSMYEITKEFLRIRVLRLWLLVDNILGIADPTLPVSQLMADNVPSSFQLPQRAADSVHALFADGGKPSGGIVPVLR